MWYPKLRMTPGWDGFMRQTGLSPKWRECQIRHLSCWTSNDWAAGSARPRAVSLPEAGTWYRMGHGSRHRTRSLALPRSLRLGEEQAKLTLPAGRELVEVRERMESIGLSACAVASFHSRVPQIPAEWVTPERLEALNCLAQRLAALAEQESLALTKYKAVLEASPISSLEEAIALTERLDAYNLDRKPATPEDVAREELSCVMMEEDVTLIERYLNIYGYGEALIQQYEGELTNYGPLTRADGRPVQEPLPSHPGLNSIGMRCP